MTPREPLPEVNAVAATPTEERGAARAAPTRADRRGLLSAIAGAGAALLVIAGAFVVFYSEQSYRTVKIQQADAQTRILASTVTAALAFDDRKAAQEYVNALAVDPQVQVAAVYDASGALFAAYALSPATPPPPTVAAPGARVEDGALIVVAPVQQAAATTGWVYERSVLEPISRRIERYAVIGLLVSMAALILLLLAVAQNRLARANDTLAGQRQALAEANRSLLEQIAQREQAETALRQAQKMEAIGQLTGGIAHDFNNFLQVIQGNLQLLERRGVGSDDTQRMIRAAIRSAERASTLTRRLLAFARRQPLNPVPIDVNKLIIATSELLRGTLGETVTIETALAGGLWRVAADPNQLENALLNLAVNARDAMPAGGKLRIETANAHLDAASSAGDAAPGPYVVIAVSDEGTGMTKETREQAFEPFFTTKDVGKGSGLGLSQVYGFIKQSGGYAKIDSEPGKGTTVTLYLPRLAESPDATPGAADARPPLRGREDVVILAVEDDADVRAHSVALLRELGYAVLEAADGAAALDLLDRHPDVQLLFTDVGLPGGLNGRELADEARRRHPRLRVLFTSGYARDAIVHHGRLDPGVDLLAKPFTFEALAAKVREIVDRAP